METASAPNSIAHASIPKSSGASVWLDILYLSAGLLLIPYFLWRRLIKRKQSAPWRDKLAHIKERSAGRRIWIHAVSVGEATAAETLVKALRKRLPEVEVVVSTTTVTGQSVALKRYGAENVFYYPLDLSFVVRRALDRIKPTAIVLMELEVWPNLTAEAAARGIPIIVVNGRITERSARRYRRFWFLAGGAFLRVKHWLVQSDEYAERFERLGVEPARVAIAGNVKYDAIDTALPSPAEREQTRASLGLDAAAPVFIGGSTHPSEEATLLAAYAQLRQSSCPALRLILVPRHPERINSVLNDIAAAGFAAIRRSEMVGPASLPAGTEAGPTADKRNSAVLVIDTVGELKGMYKAADVAFIGGSLIPHGGQNIMEPCGLGVAVLHGPHMHNFNDAMAILRACNGSVEVSRESLAAELEKLLLNRDAARAMAARARNAFLKSQGATDRAVECIAAELQAR